MTIWTHLNTQRTLKTRLLGIDLGDKTIGLALSDRTWQIATPLQTLARHAQALDILKKLIHDENIAGIIIGLPVNMNGTEGPQALKTRAFADTLQADPDLSAIPVVFWDERLSTSAVTRTLITGNASRRKRDRVVDKLAASYILQGALDRLVQERTTAETDTSLV